jgi:hypothetical protein
MTLQFEAKETLKELAHAIGCLTLDEYTEKIPILSHSSIGEHVRHVIELFQQLFIGYESGVINYDDRKRDIRLQQDIDFALNEIANIIGKICCEGKYLEMHSLSNKGKTISTNLHRELLYNIEHCVHHQAIIKIGLKSLNKDNIDANFGIAKSTIAYKKSCAQ